MRRVPTAPDGLEMPEFVRKHLGCREKSVCNHGFDSTTVGVGWWNRELERHGLPQTVQVSEQRGGRLARSNLFQLGHAVAADESENAVLSLLWNSLAWGTGASQRGNRRRVESVLEPERREHNVLLLQTAAAYARAGQPADAYRTLIRRGGGEIKRLGPAFFTKFLYFASEGETGTRCLILDARVAGRLAQAGWSSLPHRGGNYSYNWYTDTYASYCHMLDRWAIEEHARLGVQVWPDEIERALFAGDMVG